MASKESLLNYQAFEQQLFNKLGKWRVAPTAQLKTEIIADMATLREIAPAAVVARAETAWLLMDKQKDEFTAIQITQVEMPPQTCENAGWCIFTLACIVLGAGIMLGIYYIAGGEHL